MSEEVRQNGYEISVVTPVYNEEEGVLEFHRELRGVLDRLGVRYQVVFVDDGSRDNTLNQLKQCLREDAGRVKVIRLARNFGHQLAITAGIREATGRAVVVMDSDLQDPPELIGKFIEKWRQGHDIVYGRRTQRKGETAFKKGTARVFYKLLRAATKIDIPENVGDFYLLDRKVVDVLNRMDERHRFLRGMVAWAGFQRAGVPYVREERHSGRTKFGFWRMLKFSFDAATSFSFLPLRAIALMGTLISLLSFLGILIIVYQKLFTNTTVIGWASLMVVVLFIGGIQLLAIGVIGEYIARIGDDVKHRPLYIVQEVLE